MLSNEDREYDVVQQGDNEMRDTLIETEERESGLVIEYHYDINASSLGFVILEDGKPIDVCRGIYNYDYAKRRANEVAIYYEPTTSEDN